MYDVKNKLKSVEWSTSVANIDKNDSFPMLVKPTKETAEKYEISDDPVLLDRFWIVQRIVAHSLEEEGAYVVGPQVDIPSEYTGTFKYLADQKGNKILNQTFSSLKDVAYVMPQRVFCLKRVIAYPLIFTEGPPIDDKIRSVVLQPNEQLNILDKTEVLAALPASKFPFIGKSKTKFSAVPCLSVVVESSKEVMNLPLSTRGTFATLCNAPVQDHIYCFQDVLTGLDLPINLTTTRNCPKTLVDESFLQPGMQLRFSAIEEHEVIIGITVSEKFVEFASDGVEFHLPIHLDRPATSREQEIAYQTAVQRFLLECQMKDSLISVKDYQKSIRRHLSRNMRPSKPRPLHMVAALRSSKYTEKQFAKRELTAIACFSSVDQTTISRRSSMPSARQRNSTPLPSLPPELQQYTPPLPPRKGRSLRIPGFSGGFSELPTRPCPPTPPDLANELPDRPPPLPPNENHVPARPTSLSTPPAIHIADSRSSPLFEHSSPEIAAVRDSHSPSSVSYHYGSSSSSLENKELENRVPSPPHHAPPSPMNESRRLEESLPMMTPSWYSEAQQEESIGIFGTVGQFIPSSRIQEEKVATNRNVSSPEERNKSSAYENIVSSNSQNGRAEDSTPAPSASVEILQSQVRSPSPQFSMSSSYDNRAYVPSPVLQEMSNADKDSWSDNSSEDSVGSHSIESSPKFNFNPEDARKVVSSAAGEEAGGAFGNFDISQSSEQNMSTVINSSDSDVPRDENVETHENFTPLQMLSRASSNDSIEHSHQQSSQNYEKESESENLQTKEKRTVLYENVQLSLPVSEKPNTGNDNSAESELPRNDISKNSSMISSDAKRSDSNNNPIASHSLLIPDSPTFAAFRNVVDNESELSATLISRKYSISTDSLVSTKSSFIESDSSSQKNEEITVCESESEADRRGFWISQYSFGGDGPQHVSYACNYEKAPDDWTPPSDLSSLSVSEVANSLRFIGMNEETVEWFAAEKVDGQLLLALEGKELSEHFHLSPFQMKKLSMFLGGWRPKLS